MSDPVTTTTAAIEVANAVAEAGGFDINFSGMSILEIVATGVLLLISFGLRVWMQVSKAKLSTEDAARLDHIAKMSVSAAEEIGAREKWTSGQKLAYAQDLIKGAFPKLKGEYVDASIHGALALLELGNMGASDRRLSEAKPKKK